MHSGLRQYSAHKTSERRGGPGDFAPPLFFEPAELVELLLLELLELLLELDSRILLFGMFRLFSRISGVFCLIQRIPYSFFLGCFNCVSRCTQCFKKLSGAITARVCPLREGRVAASGMHSRLRVYWPCTGRIQVRRFF